MIRRDYTVLDIENEQIDVSMTIDQDKKSGRGQLVDFAINYRIKIGKKWHEVYRVDTAHGYLHEQKYWITPKPFPIPTDECTPIEVIFGRYYKYVTANYKRFKRNYMNAIYASK